MSAEIIIESVSKALKDVDGIEAVVLGGSRARGNATAKSDIDVGIYYQDAERLDLEHLRDIAAKFDDDHRAGIITRIGEWGPWINGGGWLVIDGIHTDFLFRDLNKVSEVLEDCLNERITMDYQPGHPFGFINAIYAAEVFYCKVLWEKSMFLQGLKAKVTPYPAPIKRGIIAKFLWEAGFSLTIAKGSLSKRDITYTAGILYRAASCLVQVLYALNETFLMNEKGAITNMEQFRLMPRHFVKSIEAVFKSLAFSAQEMEALIFDLQLVLNEVECLCQKQ